MARERGSFSQWGEENYDLGQATRQDTIGHQGGGGMQKA